MLERANKMMTLYDATKHYNVYLQTLHLSRNKKEAYRRALIDIQQFFGQETNLESMSESDVLDYVRINDPFDCDPVHTERGSVFCNFIQWLMVNHLITVWKKQMIEIEEDQDFERQEIHRYPLPPGTSLVI